MNTDEGHAAIVDENHKEASEYFRPEFREAIMQRKVTIGMWPTEALLAGGVAFTELKWMISNFRFYVYLFFLFFLGGCMGDSSLISQIKTLEKPEMFEQINIDSTLEKYIDVGMSEKVVADVLLAEGFYLFKDKDESLGGDIKKTTWIRYLEESFSLPAKYKIVIEVEVVNQKVSAYSGVYLKHMY